MADVLDMQDGDEHETPGEEKGSGVSYAWCRNSSSSQLLCVRW